MVTREFASQTTPPAALHANVTKGTEEYRAVRIKYFSQPFSPPSLRLSTATATIAYCTLCWHFFPALHWAKSIKHCSSILVEFSRKIIFQLPVLEKMKIKKEIRVKEQKDSNATLTQQIRIFNPLTCIHYFQSTKETKTWFVSLSTHH